MRLLLDSHVLLWYDNPLKLTADTRRTIDAANDVFVSTATVWELAMKQRSGKLPFAHRIADYAVACRFRLLPMLAEHAQTAADLPMHHRDPFDRMLVAQAMQEGLTLVTHDRTLRKYEVPLLLA